MLINFQFGLLEFISFENTHVSKTFLTFSGSPDKIFLFLSFMQEMISLTKSTVTSKKFPFFLCSLMVAELIPINVVSDI